MVRKFVLSALALTCLLLSLSGCKPLELARYFGLLRPYYTYEGYVVDFLTKKPIPNADFTLLEKVYYTDDKGYFKFKATGSWEDWRLTHQSLDMIKAEGYGTLHSWTIDVDVMNIIPLISPKSAYGKVIYEGNRKFKLVLTGNNYEATTFTNDIGEIYFIDLPIDVHLELYIYEGEKQYLEPVIFRVYPSYSNYILIQEELTE